MHVKLKLFERFKNIQHFLYFLWFSGNSEFKNTSISSTAQKYQKLAKSHSLNETTDSSVATNTSTKCIIIVVFVIAIVLDFCFYSYKLITLLKLLQNSESSCAAMCV